jgi:hypothetical protein
MGGGHAAYMRQITDIYTTFSSENLKGREHTENLGAYGKIISEWISGKKEGKMWIGLI